MAHESVRDRGFADEQHPFGPEPACRSMARHPAKAEDRGDANGAEDQPQPACAGLRGLGERITRVRRQRAAGGHVDAAHHALAHMQDAGEVIRPGLGERSKDAGHDQGRLGAHELDLAADAIDELGDQAGAFSAHSLRAGSGLVTTEPLRPCAECAAAAKKKRKRCRLKQRPAACPQSGPTV